MATISAPAKQAEQRLISNVTQMPLRKGRRLVAKTMDDPGADWVKVLLLGSTGTGKTFALAGVLEALNAEGRPNKIFVASCDIGGNGLRSVKQELLARGRGDLLPNLAWFEFTDYEDFAAFTSHPDVVEVTTADGQTRGLWAFDPDVLVWEGLSNFQESLVWRFVMSLESIAKDPGEAREAGVQASQVEWGQVRRSSILQVDSFLTLHNPNGKRCHKIVTCLLDTGKEDKLSGETKRGPLLMTGARDYVGPAFDLILTCTAITKPGTRVPEYKYRCDVGGATVAKRRGLPVNTVEEANMRDLWARITSPPPPPAVPAALALAA